MEAINGVTFEDWASACGNLAQGMPEDEICEILGIEMPVWSKTNDEWAGKLGDLMAADMSIATKYGEIFANPKQGKFAGGASNAQSIEDLLKIVPDYDTYQKIFWQQGKASEVGIDAVTVLEENGLNIGAWGTLNMHYLKYNNEYMDSSLSQTDPVEYQKRYEEMRAMDNKWQTHWENFYKDQKVDLGDDIDF